MYSPFAVCVKKEGRFSNFKDNQSTIIFEDMINLALFLVLANQISFINAYFSF